MTARGAESDVAVHIMPPVRHGVAESRRVAYVLKFQYDVTVNNAEIVR